jgi:two-component system sensor histidine kinase AlgZ
VVLAAWIFSYGVGIVSTVLGFGPGQDRFGAFLLQSVFGAAIVSVALFRYLFIRAQWQAKMLSEAEARVHALQSRIRPHFLFNSLNMIANLIDEDPEAAERATVDLAEMFRAGMRRADRLVPLSEELAIGRRYLDMEQRRLGERLRVDWVLDALPEDVPVLPMVLQPLLENAVSHGVQPRPEGGTVQVSGRFDGSQLVITITNPLAPDGSRRGSGMALHNIRSRLALAYGDRAGLFTERDDERFYAVLTLPGKSPG